MDIIKIIKELKDEKANLNEAINVFERLAIGGKKRRGRPPAWMKREKLIPTKLPIRMKHRHPFTKETRKRMAAAQKKRWAAARKSKNA